MITIRSLVDNWMALILTITVISLPCFQAFTTPSSRTNPARFDVSKYHLNNLCFPSSHNHHCHYQSLNSGKDYDEYVEDEEDDYYDEEYYYEKPKRKRRRRKLRRDDLGSSTESSWSLNLPSPFGNSQSTLRLPSSVSSALLAGVFTVGLGTGVTVDSQINTNPKDLASRDAVDKAAPNPKICTTYGASAMAFDQRVFVSFNPFNVYVAQADVKPACVLRSSNVVPVLQNKGLVNSKEIASCKANMNTWAFVGDLQDYPQLSCVYKSQDAQNEFLSDPKYGIGEDVYDNDREAILETVGKKSTAKQIKDELSEGEKAAFAKKAAALKMSNKVGNAKEDTSFQ